VYDLIIVGAGPAGSTAARTAGNMGLKALILEKEIFPRYKPCGGALSDRAISLLDFPLPEELCERTITGARVHFKDAVAEQHKGYRLLTLVTRSSFDDFLLKKAMNAGAEVENQKVLDFVESKDHVEVQTDEGCYKSRFLVIASGFQSRLKDRIQGQDAKDRYGICLVTEIEEKDEEIDKRLHDILDIYFGVAEGGYGWIFPHRGYYSVGIGGVAENFLHPRAAMNDFLKRNGFFGDYRIHGHLIPFGGRNRRIASPRVLLAGDSAGFVDAFTGEGIYYAIRSGQIAASAVAEKLTDKRLNLPRTYESRCRKDFGTELKYAHLLSKVMHSRPDFLYRVLTSQEEILDRYIEIAAARRTYKGFIRWMVPKMPYSILRAM
jgi:geranylgeranyl reductase family protein